MGASRVEDHFEVKGDWWLPERPDSRVPGILTFSLEHGAELALLGSLRTLFEGGQRTEKDGVVQITMTESALERSGRYPRLHGEVGITAYTLDDCFRTRSSSNLFGGQGSETIHVNRVLRGALFEQNEALEATGVSFAVAHLSDWVMETGIEEQWHWDEDDKPLEEGTPRFRLEAFEKPDRQVVTTDGRTVSLRHSVGIEGDRIDRRSLTQGFHWRVDSAGNKVPMEDLLDWASDLQDLVSIASCKTAGFDFVRFWHPDVYRQLDEGRTFPEAIDMFARWSAKSEKPTRRLYEHDLLFTIQNLGGIEGVRRWMDVAERNRGALGRVMGSRYARGMFVSDRLLNCAAALEAFDRDSTGHITSSFKTRLNRCASLASVPFTALVGDTASWAEAIRLERDEIAHHFGRRTRTTGSESLYLWQSLYFLFVMCMLRASETPEAAFDHLQQHTEYLRLAPRVQSSI